MFSSRIKPNTLGTGYWHTYDLEHPFFQPVPVSSTLAVTLDIPAESQGGLLTDDPTISPFLVAPNPQAAYLQDSCSEEESESTESPISPVNVPLPLSRVLTPQEEHILAAQFQHILDVRERELENPNTPDQPTYLQLIKQAVQFGLNVPEPPPLIEQSPPQFYQPLIPIAMAHQQQPHQQQQQQQQQQATAASATPLTGQMNGTPLDTFIGNRADVDTFMQQWCYVHSWTLGGNFLLLYAVDSFLLRSHRNQLLGLHTDDGAGLRLNLRHRGRIV